MKLIFGALLFVLAAAVGIVFFPAAAESHGPVPLAHGKDTCARCRMQVAEPGFAGELRDKNRNLTKYDDLGCLLIAMWKMHSEVPEVWAETHDTKRLIPLLDATLVVDSKIETPMGYGVIAFEERNAADVFLQKHGGKIESLEAVLKDGRRFRTKE